MMSRAITNRAAGAEPWVVMIRQLRTDNDLTQQQVADHLHISQRVYADYELGRVRIPVEHLTALAHFYSVSMDRICGSCAAVTY